MLDLAFHLNYLDILLKRKLLVYPCSNLKVINSSLKKEDGNHLWPSISIKVTFIQVRIMSQSVSICSCRHSF